MTCAFCHYTNLFDMIATYYYRFSDFVVNEINQNGEVVHLTEIDPPPMKEIADDEEVRFFW